MSIKNKDVVLGDLALIIHNNKPEKSGWWRKLNSKGEEVYVLEKPIHKNYKNKIQEFIDSKSRFEDGYFVMKESTLSYDENRNNPRTFNIIANVSGVYSVGFAALGYDTEKMDTSSINFTNDFTRFLSYITGESPKVDIIEIVGSNYGL